MGASKTVREGAGAGGASGTKDAPSQCGGVPSSSPRKANRMGFTSCWERWLAESKLLVTLLADPDSPGSRTLAMVYGFPVFCERRESFRANRDQKE
jgi:hypothetical protein